MRHDHVQMRMKMLGGQVLALNMRDEGQAIELITETEGIQGGFKLVDARLDGSILTWCLAHCNYDLFHGQAIFRQRVVDSNLPLSSNSQATNLQVVEISDHGLKQATV